MFLSSSRVSAICLVVLISGLTTGCVELPGIYYQVVLTEEPTGAACDTLVAALGEKLDLHVKRPSGYQCRVVVEGLVAKPARNVTIDADMKGRRVAVEINTFGVSSPSATQEFADRVMAVVREQFPSAEFVRYRPTRGLGP